MRQWRTAAMSCRAYWRDTFNGGHQSQYGQDELVGDVLFEGRPGIFVDVGARDGRIISNTYYLEKRVGWTGIAIEPHPDLFPILHSTRSCACCNSAVSDFDSGSLDFVKFLEEPLGNSGLLSTFRNVDRLKKIKHEIIRIPCVKLSSLLAQIEAVDYLDIDVEGHELEVLRSVDFSRVQFSIIGVETENSDSKCQTIDGFLAKYDFRPFAQLVSDRFYCRATDFDGVVSKTRSLGRKCALL